VKQRHAQDVARQARQCLAVDHRVGMANVEHHLTRGGGLAMCEWTPDRLNDDGRHDQEHGHQNCNLFTRHLHLIFSVRCDDINVDAGRIKLRDRSLKAAMIPIFLSASQFWNSI